MPRWGKFSRQHFSTSFQNPPWKTFCWTVSGMFSQHKDKSRCWMRSWEPTIEACIEYNFDVNNFMCRKYFDGYISGQKSLLQRQMDFLEMFWRIREVVIGTRNCKMTQKILQITNYSLDCIRQKRKRLFSKSLSFSEVYQISALPGTVPRWS